MSKILKQVYVKIEPESIDLNDVLKQLGLTHEQLIIVGILIGTDYNPGGIKGIGPKKALKLVLEKKDFESVFKSVEWDFEITPEQIFDFFLNPDVDRNYKNKVPGGQTHGVDDKIYQLNKETAKRLVEVEHRFFPSEISYPLPSQQAFLIFTYDQGKFINVYDGDYATFVQMKYTKAGTGSETMRDTLMDMYFQKIGITGPVFLHFVLARCNTDVEILNASGAISLTANSRAFSRHLIVSSVIIMSWYSLSIILGGNAVILFLLRCFVELCSM